MSQSQTATATYTSIPVTILAADIIFRSIQNLLGTISHRHPWLEFGSSHDRLDSYASALVQICFNAKHFRVNYLLLIGVCGFLSLIESPGLLFAIVAIVGLWMVIYFFREDPLILWGHHLSDWTVLVGLLLVSFAALRLNTGLGNVVLGLSVGLLLCGLHELIRNLEGLFLNENKAASAGLIRPTYTPV